MPLKPYDIPLVSGVDEGQSAKLIGPQRLVRAENIRFLKSGQVRKIRGTQKIGTAAVDDLSVEPVGPVNLFTHNDQLCAVCEQSLFSLSETANRWEEVEEIPITTLGQKLSLGHYGAQDVVASACAEATDFRVFAWVTVQYDTSGAEDTYRLHIQTVDKTTGAASAGTAVVTTSNAVDEFLPSVKAIGLGSKVTVFWSEHITGNPSIRYVDITSATTGPWGNSAVGTTIANGLQWDSAQSFDAANHGSGYVFCYNGASGVVVARKDAAHATQATTASPLAVAAGEIRVQIVGNCDDNGATMHVYATSGISAASDEINMWGLADDLTTAHSYSTTTTSNVRSIAAGEFSAAGGALAISQIALGLQTTTGLVYTEIRWHANGGLVSATQWIPECTPAAKPITYAEQTFLPLQFFGSRVNSGVIFARIWLGYAAVRSVVIPRPEVSLNRARGVDQSDSTMIDPSGSVIYDGSSVWITLLALDRFSGPITLAVATTTGWSDDKEITPAPGQVVERVGVDAWQFKLDDRTRGRAVRCGGYTFLGGGHVLAFDGRRAVEVGFNAFPDSTTFTPSTSGGNLADGTYTYGVCWEWHDHLGNRHQSAVKFESVTVTGGSGSGKVTIVGPPMFTLSSRYWRQSNAGDSRRITLAIYRTEADGLSMHRLEGPGVRPFIEMDPLNASVALLASIGTYEDTYNEVTIGLVSRELIYTGAQGSNELDNVAPPPARVLVAHDERLHWISDEDPTVGGYTKQLFPGTAPATNESLIIQYEEPIVALASQDGNMIALGRNSVYTVVGRPADNTGASTTYDPPQRLSTDIGCVNDRSVCPSAAGLFFEGPRGIYLMPRGGVDVQFIGKPIEDQLALYPIITDALHDPDTSTVLFSCVDSEALEDTPAGIVLVYHYDVGQWVVRSYGGNPVSSITRQSGDITLGIYAADDAIEVWQEDTGNDDADAAFISWLIQLGDIRLSGGAGLHSLNSVTLLGEALGVGTLNIREKIDSGDWGLMRSWDVIAAEGELVRTHQTRNRKATRHILEISETAYGATVDSAGIALSLLRLDGQPLSGAARLPRGKR